jgi:GNAT superfamily N-acetyltransferase
VLDETDRFIRRFGRAGRFMIKDGDLFRDGLLIGVMSIVRSGDVVELWHLGIGEPFQGRGFAREAMAQLLGLADEAGVTLALSPAKDFGASLGRLTKFYAGFGFKPNRGRNKEWQTRQSMVRKPLVKARVKS